MGRHRRGLWPDSVLSKPSRVGRRSCSGPRSKNLMSKIKHIALVKFKEGTSEEQIGKIFDLVLDITETIPGIEDYVSGPNCSPEGLNQGYTHALIITFADIAARDAYLAHAEHQRFKSQVLPDVESILVVDFEV